MAGTEKIPVKPDFQHRVSHFKVTNVMGKRRFQLRYKQGEEPHNGSKGKRRDWVNFSRRYNEEPKKKEVRGEEI